MGIIIVTCANKPTTNIENYTLLLILVNEQ